jgi:2-polyprenyl-3-methyl-5-hydroxy-6-metoxy-1,4-benzoquinol methylase
MAGINELKAKANRIRWFNAFDFGAFQARGREAPGEPYFNGSLFGTFDLLASLDLRGLNCIDIGSGSGLVAIGMKELGASYVAAADAIPHPAFDVAMEITGHRIDLRMTSATELARHRDWIHAFDVVVCSGLLYHLWNPFELVVVARKLLKSNGIFILQSLCVTDDRAAALYLNTERNVNGDPTTYFVPGVSAMTGMLKAACFDIIAQRNLTRWNKFVAFMARSSIDPDEIKGRAPNCQKIHAVLKADPAYNFGGYDFRQIVEDAPASAVKIPQIQYLHTIDEATYECRFPYNPRELTDPVGLQYR